MATEKSAAVSYLRVSGRGQVDGDGFPRQRDTIAKFAKVRKLKLVDEYRDEGVSGTTELDNRPGLAEMLDRIDSNGVRVVIVENASRLARDLMVQEILLTDPERESRARGTNANADSRGFLRRIFDVLTGEHLIVPEN